MKIDLKVFEPLAVDFQNAVADGDLEEAVPIAKQLIKLLENFLEGWPE